MNKLFLLSLSALTIIVLSCGTQKSNNTEKQTTKESTEKDSAEEEDQTNPNHAIGKVILSKEGCQLKLILENEENNCYYPVNLDEKFKVDGAYLQFQKYPSRAPLPKACESCRTIQVENVVRLKR